MTKVIKKLDKTLKLYLDLEKELRDYIKLQKEISYKKGMNHIEYNNYIIKITNLRNRILRLLEQLRIRLNIPSILNYT